MPARPTPLIRKLAALAALAHLAGVLPIHAQSLTTNFNLPSSFLEHHNVGTLFSLTALHPQGITISSFDVHPFTPAGTPVEVEVFFKQGPFHIHPQTPDVWTLAGRAQATAMGQGLPTPVPAAAGGSIFIPSGQTYSIYLNHTRGGVRFNIESATTTNVANADLRMTLGAAQSLHFGGVLSQPRGFMGTVHYTTGNANEMGACCLPTGECAYTTEAGCDAAAGTYSGHFITCSSIVLSCPQPMSCCLPAALGGCLDITQPNCARLGGDPGNTFQCGSTPYWAAPASCGGVLLSRAGLISHEGAAFDGAHLAMAPGFDNIAGLPASTSAGGGGQAGRLADTFSIYDTSGWRIDDITLFGLIAAPAGAPYTDPPQSPFTGANINIWNGPPNEPGSTIIASTATVRDTGWTGIYRVPNHISPDNTQRLIMFIRMGLSAHLPRGEYWIDYTLEGAQGGETDVFTPPAIFTMRYPQIQQFGIARQRSSSGEWLGINRRLPLTITGQLGSASCYANCDGSTIGPMLNVDDFTCFINEFALALSFPSFWQPMHYANCDQSTALPVLNIDDFTCFINQFAAGCR